MVSNFPITANLKVVLGEPRLSSTGSNDNLVYFSIEPGGQLPDRELPQE